MEHSKINFDTCHLCIKSEGVLTKLCLFMTVPQGYIYQIIASKVSCSHIDGRYKTRYFYHFSSRPQKIFVQILPVFFCSQVPPFAPKENVRIAANDAEAEAQANNAHTDQDRLVEVESQLPSREIIDKSMLVHPAEFEKDDDANFHMDFIVAASNARAENYSIVPADRHKSKLVNYIFTPIFFNN